MTPADAALRAEWRAHYQAVVSASAPPSSATPAPTPPPSAVPVVSACPAPRKTGDCKEIKNHVQEGDIVVRGERGDAESDAIARISQCNYSHAGIVARNDKGELVVVDAYPGRGSGNSSAVQANSLDNFFCDHKATQGMVARPKDQTAAKKAAEWAMGETKDPNYTFDLWDPWNQDNKRLYCSDFVYQSFQNAGVDLVPSKMDFLSPANKKNTIEAAREFKGGLARIASDSKIEQEMLKMTGGSSEYITPCQVASNAGTEPAVIFDAGSRSAGTGGKKTSK